MQCGSRVNTIGTIHYSVDVYNGHDNGPDAGDAKAINR